MSDLAKDTMLVDAIAEASALHRYSPMTLQCSCAADLWPTGGFDKHLAQVAAERFYAAVDAAAEAADALQREIGAIKDEARRLPLAEWSERYGDRLMKLGQQLGEGWRDWELAEALDYVWHRARGFDCK